METLIKTFTDIQESITLASDAINIIRITTVWNGGFFQLNIESIKYKLHARNFLLVHNLLFIIFAGLPPTTIPGSTSL